ncbi:MAG: TIGR04255 family protein [Candidatus Thiodiazotropha taylori]
MADRPQNLPDFASPPLGEVVIGVQFAPSKKYSAVFSKDIWELYRADYPYVQEQPPLEPSFETFGGSNYQPNMQFQLGNSPRHSRLWFSSKDHSHLIQFQSDRFLLNWRKSTSDHTYPRFESISATFEKHLKTLKEYYLASLKTQLEINQAEVTYVNNIPLDNYPQVGEWFRFFDTKEINVEGVNISFTEVFDDLHGKPSARMTYELQSVISVDGKSKAFRFVLTYRGKPAGKDISQALSFAYQGREMIVNRFKELTTKRAHQSWEIVE